MIFVTVGEQLPFDRLVRTVDEWAAVSGEEVFAQIGASNFTPQNIKYKNHLDLHEFKEIFTSAECIIAHAGMGTIITAIEMRKLVIIMPRQAALGEHRNDHQFATAKKFMRFDCISVALDETELKIKLARLKDIKQMLKKEHETTPSSKLIETIKCFIS